MLSMQSNTHYIDEDEGELTGSEDIIDEDVWKRFRLQEWTEDITVAWTRSVHVSINDKSLTQYLLEESIMMHGYDGKKLKEENILKLHPTLLSPAKRVQIVLKLIDCLVINK